MEKVAAFRGGRYPEIIGNPRRRDEGRPDRRRQQSYQTLFEVLGQLLAPEKTIEIIDAALEDMGWRELPSGRAKFEMLVDQAVAPRVTQVLGVADAEVVIDELLRIAQMMPDEVPRSGERVRPKREPESNTSPITLPAPANLVIALATGSHTRLERLESRVAGTARVRGVRDAISLFDVLQSEHVALLLVDLVDPALRWPTLLALAEDVPPTTNVCVWSANESLRAAVEKHGWTFVVDEHELDAAVDDLASES